MPKIHPSKVTVFSCHASHNKSDSTDTSKLFRNLVKTMKQVQPLHTDKIVAEILNRTAVFNLTPAEELQYDDPNISRIEEITNLRIFWTFAYDLPYSLNTSQESNEIKNIQGTITYAILHTMEQMKNTPIQILYTTAPPPKPTSDTTYSLIEIPNPLINVKNIFDVREVFITQFGEDIVSFINYLISFNNHTRYYISINKATPEDVVLSTMSEFYKLLTQKLNEINKTIGPLRKYSNELVYFSPNSNEVSRSLIPMLNRLTLDMLKSDIRKVINHPFILHSEWQTGYSLLCGPDYILEKTDDDIHYFRIVNMRKMRIGPNSKLSISKQLSEYFTRWVSQIRVNKEDLIYPLPIISPYIVVIHACNRCDSEEESCSCFLDIPVNVTRKGVVYRPSNMSNWITYTNM